MKSFDELVELLPHSLDEASKQAEDINFRKKESSSLIHMVGDRSVVKTGRSFFGQRVTSNVCKVQIETQRYFLSAKPKT